MTPVEPTLLPPVGGRQVVLAKDQPQYMPLPALLCPLHVGDLIIPDGQVITEWELTDDELAALFAGGKLRVTLFTFGRPLQPIRPEVVSCSAENVVPM